MFEFFQNTGWIILLIIGVIWGVIRLSSKKKKPLPDWSLLASTSIITFMFGVLIAVRASSGFPQIITGYGVEAPNCGANVTTTRLRSFRDEYRIGLVCGFGDPSRDQLDDDRVTVSNLFHISQGSFSIIAPYSDRMRTLADQLRTAAAAIPGGIHAQIWHVAVLLPSNVQSTEVHKLSDVLDLKGKILTPELFR